MPYRKSKFIKRKCQLLIFCSVSMLLFRTHEATSCEDSNDNECYNQVAKIVTEQINQWKAQIHHSFREPRIRIHKHIFDIVSKTCDRDLAEKKRSSLPYATVTFITFLAPRPATEHELKRKSRDSNKTNSLHP